VTQLKRNTKIGILIASCLVAVIVVSIGFVGANSTYDINCASCHNNTGTISISAPSSISTETGQEFQLDVDITGGGSLSYLYAKFPGDVDDNTNFDISPENAQGGVYDNGEGDDNPASGAMTISYTITAPAFPGEYTLTLFAVGSSQNNDQVSVTVTVAASGEGPIFTSIGQSSEYPPANEDVTINATLQSTADIDEVILSYSINNGTSWNNVTMTEVSSDYYEGDIPAQVYGTEVLYKVIASDIDGLETESGVNSYVAGFIPVEPIEIPQLHYGWYLGLPALVLAYIGTALEYYDEERFTRGHGIMLSLAYILTSINVLFLLLEGPSTWNNMNPQYLFDLTNMLTFIHCWHIWIGITSMILGTLAFLTHLGGWKTCNLGLPAVILWTLLGFTGVYLGVLFRM